MPPKKKAKLPSRAPSMASQDNQSVAATPTRAETPLTGTVATPTVPADPWTDEQEISLLKGIVNWKPAGMHKHFRMIAIAQQLRHHGVAGPNDQHTRIPGIWQKLRTLYNLEAIDERENVLDLEDDDEDEEEGSETKKEPFYPFSLPMEEFGELMFEKRLANDGSSSPPILSNRQLNALRRGSDPSVTSNTRGSTAGIDDTEEDTDVKSTPQPRGRKPGARGGRSAKATPKSQVKPGPKKRGRKLVAKPAEEDEATGEEEADEEEEENENEEEEEEQDDSTAAGSPSGPPAKRGGTKAVRGGGRPKRGQGIADIRRSSRRK